MTDALAMPLNTLPDSCDVELFEAFYWSGDGARSQAGWYFYANDPHDNFSDDELMGPFFTEYGAMQEAEKYQDDIDDGYR